ncbi:hypothetical protein BJF79_25115 [Actinomadura sp. CNU-125]|uniref:DUF4190 domain-containing protein n=1 Tax=Actinomadura sp. CNU-125 TaxID=1904961 RepID=UPI00095AABFF|nr:DUF4190 domain-containing protein [Actinomadura sp. CNU-125]OLT10941.1 hypothetical protein BJF79_25115 [Actinomadura sp. CNU-125]
MRNLATLLRGQGRGAEAESWTRYADAVATRPASPYGPPAHHAPPRHPHAKPPLNSYAIYALTFGLVGLVTCGLPSIPAIVAGHLAWVRVRRSGERGLGLALTGIALGWIMIAFWLLILIGILAPPAEGE